MTDAETHPENTTTWEASFEASAGVACAHGQTGPHDDCPGPGVEPETVEE